MKWALLFITLMIISSAQATTINLVDTDDFDDISTGSSNNRLVVAPSGEVIHTGIIAGANCTVIEYTGTHSLSETANISSSGQPTCPGTQWGNGAEPYADGPDNDSLYISLVVSSWNDTYSMSGYTGSNTFIGTVCDPTTAMNASLNRLILTKRYQYNVDLRLMCLRSPLSFIGTGDTADFTWNAPTVAGSPQEVGILDWETNRVVLANSTHAQVHELNDANNETDSFICETDISGGGRDVWAHNNWFYTLDTAGTTIRVYSGATCAEQESVLIPTLACGGAVSSQDRLTSTYVDEDGIHCLRDGDTTQLLLYSADWPYPNVAATSEVETGCESPCLFNDTFTYSSSLCNFGWQSTNCGNTVANGTHFTCDDSPETVFHTLNPPADASNGFVFVNFRYQHIDTETTTFIDFQAESGSSIATLRFDGFDGDYSANLAEFDLGSLDNQSHNYSVRLNFDTETYRVSRDGSTVLSGIPFRNSQDNLRLITVQGDILLNQCDWNFDSFLITGDVTIGSPGGPGGSPIGVNQSQLQFIDGFVDLQSIDPDTGRLVVFNTSQCRTDELEDVCILRKLGGGIFNGLVDLVLSNIVIVLVIVLILLVIGLAKP